MQLFDKCNYHNCGFLYIDNPIWKHAPRTEQSKNNLILVTEGTLYIEQSNIRYVVKKGDVLFLESGVPSIGYKPCTEKTGFYYIIFDSPGGLPFQKHVKLYEYATAQELFNQILHKTGCTDYPAEAITYLMRALFCEVIYQSFPHEQSAVTLADNIKKYIHASMWRNITINDIAAHFGFCPDYISRAFQKGSNDHISLKQYLNNLKIQTIENQLSAPNATIKTVAENLGFVTPSSLCKYYKYHTGRTPSEYRQRFYSKKIQ